LLRREEEGPLRPYRTDFKKGKPGIVQRNARSHAVTNPHLFLKSRGGAGSVDVGNSPVLEKEREAGSAWAFSDIICLTHHSPSGSEKSCSVERKQVRGVNRRGSSQWVISSSNRHCPRDRGPVNGDKRVDLEQVIGFQVIRGKKVHHEECAPDLKMKISSDIRRRLFKPPPG